MGLVAPIVTGISYIAPNSCFSYFTKFRACAISRKLRWLRYRGLRESTDQHPFTGGRCHQIYATIIINLIYQPESVTGTAQIRWETRKGILGCKVINSRILILISSTPSILVLDPRRPRYRSYLRFRDTTHAWNLGNNWKKFSEQCMISR